MKSFLLKNSNNMQVEVLNWGARIVSIRVPDSSGTHVNAVLGYTEQDEYLNDPYNMGSTIGRYANRIANASFDLDGKAVELSVNEVESRSHLHGGFVGFDKKYWQVENATENSLELTLKSPDGEEGYPGNLTVSSRFELTANNQLILSYSAICDKTTVANLTNHSYFNLTDDQQSIDTHDITVHAERYAPLDRDHIPEEPYINQVDNTIYDLRNKTSAEKVKKAICNANYFVNNVSEVKEIALLTERNTGRQLRISSDYPSLQVYFAEFLKTPFKPFQGICCEPHYAPNSPNIGLYASVLLRPNQEYNHKIIYSFENF